MMGSGSRFDPLGGQEETVWTQSGRTVVACAPSAADVAWHNGRFRTDRCTVATPPTTGFVFLVAEAVDDSSKAAEPGSLLCAARDFGLAGHRHVTPPSPCPPRCTRPWAVRDGSGMLPRQVCCCRHVENQVGQCNVLVFTSPGMQRLTRPR